MPMIAAVHAATGIVRARPLRPEKRLPTRWVRTMYTAQPTAARPAYPTPTTLMSPRQGWVTSTTPNPAAPTQMSALRLWLCTAATVIGPRNSMATEVPSGMRPIAARNAAVCRPVVTPRPRSTGASCQRRERNGGRAITRKMTAPAVSLSHAMPPGPTVEIRCTDSAEPSWTENIAPIASDHGGAEPAPKLRSLMRRDQTPATPPRVSDDASRSKITCENLADFPALLT